MRARPMAADLLLPAIAGALILGGTDRGRALARGAWQGATGPKPKGKGGKASGGKKSAPAKKASGKPTAKKPARKKKGAVSAAVGAWAGRQGRKAAAAAGRQTKKAAVAVHAKVGDKAQARWEKRTDHAKPVSRTPTDTATEPAPQTATTPTEATPSSKPVPSPSPAQPASKETAMSSVTEIEAPQSDGHLLANFHQLTEDFKAMAQAVSEHAGVLMSAQLPTSVTQEIHAAAECAAAGSNHVVKAGQAFEAHFQDARNVAQHGVKILGQDAA